MERNFEADLTKRYRKPPSNFLESQIEKNKGPGEGEEEEEPEGESAPPPDVIIIVIDTNSQNENDPVSQENTENDEFGFTERPLEDQNNELNYDFNEEIDDELEQENLENEPKEEMEDSDELENQQERIEELLEKAAEVQEKTNDVKTEKNQDDKKAKENEKKIEKNHDNKNTKEKEKKTEHPQVKVAEKQKPSEKTKDIDSKLERVKDFEDSFNELNRLESMFNDLYHDLNNNENWTKGMDQEIKNIQEKINEQKEIADFWAYLGTLSDNEVSNHTTDVENLNNTVLENLIQMYDFALENPITYEKNAEAIALKLNVSKNYLVSRFQDISNKLEYADPNNPYQMESLLNQIEQYNLDNLNYELNKAYAEDPRETISQKIHDDHEIANRVEPESVSEKQSEKIDQPIERNEIHSELIIDGYDNKLKETEKVEKTESDIKLVFENIKEERGTEIRIFTDGTLEVKGSTSSSGLQITRDALKWKELPKSKGDEKINVIASFEWINNQGKKIRVENVYSEISNNNYSIQIKPFNLGQESIVKENMRNNTPMTCEIKGTIQDKEQIESTEHFKEAARVMEEVEMPNFEELVMVNSGWTSTNNFEVYVNEKGRAFVKGKTKIDSYGRVWLYGELASIIEDWFVDDSILICSKDNEKPIALKPLVREIRSREGRLVKEINFPYYGENKSIEIIFTSPNMKLTDKSKEELGLKNELNKAGIKINSIKIDRLMGGKHKVEEKEKEITNIVEEAYKQMTNSTIYSDVEIIAEFSENENRIGNRHVFDKMVIRSTNNQEIYVDLIEIKTAQSGQKLKLVDNEISNIMHFSKQLNPSKITPIIIFDGDLTGDGKVTTRKFGDAIGIILIGNSELEQIKNSPELLESRIKEFREENSFRIEKSTNTRVEPILSIEEVDNSNELYNESLVVLNENEELLKSRIPDGIKIIGILQGESEGSDYEKQVKEGLEAKGYKVASNVRLSYYGRFMEIDQFAFKDDEMKIVSCKDKSSSTNVWSVGTDIINEANTIEFRMGLLGADSAAVYTNIHRDISEATREKFSRTNWVQNVSIEIDVKETKRQI